nr:flagellar filament capping protein FliD [uncultured Oscillibacter sp.]
MASISGISSSSSLYGNRNVISGLASGMDTESMIENAVSGYKAKIAALQQKRTKTEWKQDAYRSIVNKMSVFAEKYTSYMSGNNLMSASFFNNAVKTVAKGKYADKVTAVGRASSSIQIDRVLQMATAASYKLKGSALDPQTSSFGEDISSVTASASGTMDLDGTTTISKLNGSMTLAYGGADSRSYLTINFDETKTYDGDPQKLADEINRQLSEQSVTIGSNTYTGKELLNKVVKAEVGEDGNITFADPKGNNVFVSRATGSVQELLLRGEEPSSQAGSQLKKLWLGKDALATEDKSNLSYLSGSSVEITVDGKTKTIKMPTLDEIAAKVDSSYQYADALKTKIQNGSALTNDASRQERDKAFMAAFQEKIDEAFGKGKLTVSDKNGTDAGIQLQFTAAKGSTFSVNATKGNVMGMGESKSVTSYLNTGKTLGDLLGKDMDWSKFDIAYEKDANGNPTSTPAKDSEGNQLYSFKVNGKEVGQFNANSKLSDVFNAMNNNEDSTVKVSYSKLTNEISFTAKDTGSNGAIKFDGLAAELFGVSDASAEAGFSKGQDAIFEASVNGTSLGTLTRSSNDIDLDGMTVTLKGTFGYEEAQGANEGDQGVVKGADGKLYKADGSSESVTFETSADSDKIVDVIKKMVEDYNAMVTEIKNAYSVLPAQQSNGKYYEPMTAEEEEKYSESFVKNWNEKAKQGLLFGDRDLANLYSSLTSAISMTGESGAVLRAAGITVNYANGLSTLDFDEDKFRAAMDKDPDKIRDAFTASTDAGAASSGLMEALKQPLDMYGKTSGGKGILVEKAGSPLAASSMYSNLIQQELDDIDSQITKWQDKLSDKVDYYTNQFSRLEQLIQQMNSQSSYFSQLSGG